MSLIKANTTTEAESCLRLKGRPRQNGDDSMSTVFYRKACWRDKMGHLYIHQGMKSKIQFLFFWVARNGKA